MSIGSPGLRYTHLETPVQVLHLLGILSFSHADVLLRLFCLGLDILSDLDELVDCDLEGSDKGCGIEGWLGVNPSSPQSIEAGCKRLTSRAGLGLRDQLLRDGGDKVLDFEFSLCTIESVDSVEREDAKDILRNLRH